MGLTNSVDLPKTPVIDDEILKYKKELEEALDGKFEAMLDIDKLIFHTPNNSNVIESLQKFFKPHAESGNSYAQAIYGWCFQQMKDYERAHKWYVLGVDKGNSYAMDGLSNLYWAGKYVVGDSKKSYDLTVKCHAAGNPFGIAGLGYFYYAGIIVKHDLKKAFELFSQAATAGICEIYHKLAEMYLEGEGTEPDSKMAEHFFTKAIECNNMQAAISLAKMYKEGTGVEPDPVRALEYCLNYDYDEKEQEDVDHIITEIMLDKENKEALRNYFAKVKKSEAQIKDLNDEIDQLKEQIKKLNLGEFEEVK